MPSRPSRHRTPGWRKSKYSNTGADCVEVASAGSLILVRDSRSRETVLAFSANQWSVFMRHVQSNNGSSASL